MPLGADPLARLWGRRCQARQVRRRRRRQVPAEGACGGRCWRPCAARGPVEARWPARCMRASGGGEARGPAEARRPARQAWACGARACGPAEAPAGRWRGAARAGRQRWQRVRLWRPSCGEACGCSWQWQGRRAGCARPPQEVAGSRGRRREMELRQRALWSCDHSHKVPESTGSRNGVEGRHFIKLWYEGGILLWNDKLLYGTRP